MTLLKLNRADNGEYVCPECGHVLQRVAGDAVTVVDGKFNMEDTKTRYECDSCKVFYRELLDTDYYDVFPLQQKKEKKKKILATGELQPMKLHLDKKGRCSCPRCGADMVVVEGQPVRIVDGKPTMEDVASYFRCEMCSSIYRRIVNTEYFQWAEK